MTETLILGELTLISKHGIETKTELHEGTNFFRDIERMEGGRHLASFDKDGTLDDMDLIEPLPVIGVQPLDIPIEVDYISGNFIDGRHARAKYGVTVWLLIEEEPEQLSP